MKRVTWPPAIQSHTAFASKRGSMWQVAPDCSAQHTTLIIPCTWCNGRHSKMRSAADHSQASTRLLICAVVLAWVVTTPFGRLVVPLVYRIMARRALEITGRSDGWERASCSYVSARKPRLAAIGSTNGAAWRSNTTIDARV